MTALPDSTELELVADQITQTIYSAPFAQASRRQQELALTSARRILAALAPTIAQIKTSEVTA